MFLSIIIYKEDSTFCVHISKFQFYPLKYNYLLNFLKLVVILEAFTKWSISASSFFSYLSSFLIYFTYIFNKYNFIYILT